MVRITDKTLRQHFNAAVVFAFSAPLGIGHAVQGQRLDIQIIRIIGGKSGIKNVVASLLQSIACLQIKAGYPNIIAQGAFIPPAVIEGALDQMFQEAA
ncbi:hypothetical protein D3C75_948220 [compost metagenome]